MTSYQLTINDLKETVALAHRLLFLTGLATVEGHASARIPGTDRFLIKPWPHIHLNRIRAEDIITMNLDGNIIEGKTEKVTRVSEWPIHAEVYRAHPDVGAVIHTHQRWASLMGIAGKPILPVLGNVMAHVVADPFPIFDEDYHFIRTVEQGRLVAETMGNAIGCHLLCHGMVFAGPNLETTTIDAISVEYQAEITWRAMLIGAPKTIPKLFLRPGLERRKTGEVPPAWEHYWKWIDQHPESARLRRVQL